MRKKIQRTAFAFFRGGELTDSRGAQYTQGQDGVIHRADPKPWRGKSERRKVIKARREDRALAAANLKS